MFVREKGRGGTDRAFLPDIELFSVQVDGKQPVVNVRGVAQLQPMFW